MIRLRLRLAAWLVVVAAVVVAVWTAVALVQARDDLTAARAALVEAAEAKDPATAARRLADAERRLSRAAGRLQQLGPRFAAAVPLMGRTVEAARETAIAGAVVSDQAGRVLDAVPDDLLAPGRVDLAGLAEVERALRNAADRTRQPVQRLVALELDGTPDAVAKGVREAQTRVANVPGTLLRAADLLDTLNAVLGGDRDRRLLVVLQNNAELRATGGLVSVFAQATARDGAVQVEAFQEVEDVADPPATAERVPAPDDYRALFAPFKAGTTLWKNVNMAADVPTSSTVLASIARASLGQAPEVVVWLDVPAIARVLRATGPVELPDGSTLSTDNAVRRLLSEAYLDADDSAGGQARRREVLRSAADAVLGQLLAAEAEVAPLELIRQLRAAAAGRHLAVWSTVPFEQRRLEAGGAAGAVFAGRGDLHAAAAHNLGDGKGFGNKLDFYSRRLVSARVEVERSSALVEQELSIRNIAPTSGLPFYVTGRHRPGVLNQLVSLALPADASVEAFSRGGQALSVEPRPLADHAVLFDAVALPPGQTTTWRLRYRVPVRDGRYRLRLFPQPLAVDAGLSLTVLPAPGLMLQEGPVTFSGPFAQTVVLDVVAQRPPWLSRARDAVHRFWNEPVRLP